MPAAVYILRLRSDALYIGSSLNLVLRLADHASGKGGRTTRLDPPIAFVRLEPFPTLTAARHREAQLKRWSRAKKEALIRQETITLKTLSRSHD